MNEFIQMRKKDHVEVKGILGRLIETEETKKPEELFHTLGMAFVPHMKAEESTCYPPLCTEEETREDAIVGIEYFDEAERRGWYGS